MPHSAPQTVKKTDTPPAPKSENADTVKKPNSQKNKRGIGGILNNLLPEALYSTKSKKIFGIFSAEDLLLIALILIFSDSGSEDGNLMCLILIYVLLSDYVDLSEFF